VADLTKLDPARTALVIIDLQRMIMARDTKPYAAAEVLARNVELADAMREAGGLVVCVHVSFRPDFADRLMPSADQTQPAGTPPAGYDAIMPELKPDAERTICVPKKQWGAFYGTDLDLQLRRRGIDTIVLTGISTNIGVESTARNAFELGYKQFFVEDAMAALSEEEHQSATRFIFPRIGHVCRSEDVLRQLRS
jgi:nicotinamidase-related amidase